MEEDTIREALKMVQDPEAGMSIVDLGLVYSIACEPGRVRVEMTMTSPACPGHRCCRRGGAAITTWRRRHRRQIAWCGAAVDAEREQEAHSRFGWTG